MTIAEYQQQLIERTEQFRPEAHVYAGYNGPWLENQFFEHWQLHKPHSPRLFVPIAWSDCKDKSVPLNRIEDVFTELDRQYTYFTVSQKPLGAKHSGMGITFPPELDLLIFSAGGDHGHVPTIPVPLLKEELIPKGYAKSISVSFQGTLTRHTIRHLLHERFGMMYLFLENSENWKRILESSTFAFCPRGVRPTSFRLYEALQLGTIPIIVWEDDRWLPFEESIRWSEIAILVPADDLSQLPQLIAEANVPKMQLALARVRHKFTYGYTIEYILEIARRRRPYIKEGRDTD